MNLGSQIQALRRKKGITQEILAAEMGVTVGAVSKWENNITLPDVQMLCSLRFYRNISWWLWIHCNLFPFSLLQHALLFSGSLV